MSSKLLDQNMLLNKAVQLLAQRNHSTIELSQKLLRSALLFHQKNYHQDSLDSDTRQQYEQLVQGVVLHCAERNWLNDNDYIQQYMRVRARKGYGKTRITLELKQKGFKSSVITEAFNLEFIDWLEIGVKQVLKKFPVIEKSDTKQKIKIFQFLISRGFSQDEISEIYQQAIIFSNG